MRRAAAVALSWLRGAGRRVRRAKLRTRVLVGVLAVTLVALAAFDVAAVTALRSYLIGQTDSQLREVLSVYQHAKLPTATIARAGPVQANRRRPGQRTAATPPHFVTGRPAGPRIPGLVLQLAPLQQFSVTLVRGARFTAVSPRVSIPGRTIRNAALQTRIPANLTALVAGGLAETVPGPGGHGQLRRMALRYPGGGFLVGTTSLSGVDRTVGQLELILVIGSSCAGLLAAAGVAWVMRRGLRPIEVMAGQADLISAGDLADRVTTRDSGTEVGRLGTAINGMLSRIEDFMAEREASQEAARQFFADASHELRTPLASLRANAELYQQGALTSRPQVDEAMRRITLEAQRMSGLVDDMLRLARLDQHPSRQREPVDVSTLVNECVRRARVTDPQRTWRAEVTAGLEVAGDEELLRRAIDNLLANVRSHTPPDTAATIAATQSDGVVAVTVTDNGPGVPWDQLPRIFERFYRAGAPSSRPGSGLGLAIVAAVAAAHDGRAEAAPAVPHGLQVTLTVPARHQPAAGPAIGPAETVAGLAAVADG